MTINGTTMVDFMDLQTHKENTASLPLHQRETAG